VGKADPTCLVVAVVGDEEQVVLSPLRLFRCGCGSPLRHHDTGENPSQCHNWKAFRLELYEENAPRLVDR